jgi:hypothetical protein
MVKDFRPRSNRIYLEEAVYWVRQVENDWGAA